MSRPVSRVITAHSQMEGAGISVRRPFPTHELDMVDPFILLDEVGPVDFPAGQVLGGPPHPHRGFEILGITLAGEYEHQDSAGEHRFSFGPGDASWMTAGAGIVHTEMPTADFMRKGGLVHGFQIWINLPARDKMIKPRYQELPAARIPTAKTEDGKVTVRVLSGDALGAKAVIESRTPILAQHWTLQPGAAVDQPVPVNFNVFTYIFQGQALVGAEERPVGRGQLAIFGAGDAVRLACAPSSTEPVQLLLLGGVPLNEPVVRYGPFVMNTREQIMQAIIDYQSGRMGRIG